MTTYVIITTSYIAKAIRIYKIWLKFLCVESLFIKYLCEESFYMFCKIKQIYNLIEEYILFYLETLI